MYLVKQIAKSIISYHLPLKSLQHESTSTRSSPGSCMHVHTTDLGEMCVCSSVLYCQLTFQKIDLLQLRTYCNIYLFYNNIYYIIILDMFRAIACSSSGGQIVLLQHLVSSLFVSSYSMHRLRAESK